MTGGISETAGSVESYFDAGRPGAAVAAIVAITDIDLSTWWASVISLVRTGARVILLSALPAGVLLEGNDLAVEVRNQSLADAGERRIPPRSGGGGGDYRAGGGAADRV